MLPFNRPLIAAHRGFSAQYPENTMISFEAAVHTGAQMIELDVTLSKDGEIVVIHDSTVDRTSNGSGPVSCLTLKELKQLDAGSWFHARFSGEKLPILKEVLDAFRNRIFINIEIKGSDALSMFLPGVLEEKTVALVEKLNAENRILISSFDAAILERVLRINASMAVALLVEAPCDTEPLALCNELKPFSFHPQFKILNSAMVAQCHSKGIYVFCWDVQTGRDVDTCFQMGVDGIFVDDPMMAIERCRQTDLD